MNGKSTLRARPSPRVGGLKTRVKLWDSLRTVFRMVPAQNMDELHVSNVEIYFISLI